MYRTAPEVFKTGHYSTKSDIWSFGVVMWEIFESGATPFGGMSNKQVVEELQRGTTLNKPFNCSDEVFAIMTECWHQVEHEFMFMRVTIFLLG
jgi:serine/threonine protein kinase